MIGTLKHIQENIQALKLEKLFRDLNHKVAITFPLTTEYKHSLKSNPGFVTRMNLSMQDALRALGDTSVPRRRNAKLGPKEIGAIATEETYHSLTIEGYDVTKEIIRQIQKGEEIGGQTKDKLAAKGFLNALDFIKQLTTVDLQVTETLTEELWKQLWSPSLNAELITDSTIYRNHLVMLRGSAYVPPNHEKVRLLLNEFFNYANEFDNGFRQGIFLHYFYVTIHPHGDGNGRLSRFLMNLAFIQDRYNWLTIPSNKRDEYFESLEKSQTQDDIGYFADFITQLYKSNP